MWVSLDEVLLYAFELVISEEEEAEKRRRKAEAAAAEVKRHKERDCICLMCFLRVLKCAHVYLCLWWRCVNAVCMFVVYASILVSFFVRVCRYESQLHLCAYNFTADLGCCSHRRTSEVTRTSQAGNSSTSRTGMCGCERVCLYVGVRLRECSFVCVYSWCVTTHHLTHMCVSYLLVSQDMHVVCVCFFVLLYAHTLSGTSTRGT